MNPDSDDRIFRAFAVVLIGERRVLFAEARLGEKGRWNNEGMDEGKGYQWTAKGIEEIANTEEAAEIKGV